MRWLLVFNIGLGLQKSARLKKKNEKKLYQLLYLVFVR
jgi:hypothetical protein